MGRTRIRTPDQRLRVFVSSTLGELAEERQAVSRAVAALDQSDIFIGLYWERYVALCPFDAPPLTDEPWGVRRFFVEDPGGTIVNVLAHIT